MGLMELDEGRLVVYPSQKGLVAVILLGAISCAPLLLLAMLGGWLLRTVVGALVAFLVLRGLVITYTLFRKYPLLVADSTGIIVRTEMLMERHIPWDDIAGTSVYTLHGQRALGIWPGDLESFLAQQRWWKRRLMEASLAMGFPPVNIPQRLLPMPVEELQELLYSLSRGGVS